MASAPHLVLDGADLVATAAGRGPHRRLCGRPRRGRPGSLARALGERGRGGGPRPGPRSAGFRPLRRRRRVRPGIGGGGGPGLPRFRPDKSRPAAHRPPRRPDPQRRDAGQVALIARYGADWFREVGAPEAPGTCLVTVSGGVGHPVSWKWPPARPFPRSSSWPGSPAPAQAVLVGGYGGPGCRARTSGRLSHRPDCGEWALRWAPACSWSCPRVRAAQETARIARFMAAESAGQCGPCLFGLPAIADDLGAVADGTAGPADARPARGRAVVR